MISERNREKSIRYGLILNEQCSDVIQAVLLVVWQLKQRESLSIQGDRHRAFELVLAAFSNVFLSRSASLPSTAIPWFFEAHFFLRPFAPFAFLDGALEPAPKPLPPRAAPA
eukprot:3525732-Pleurochrysis_carterae.AAC.1